MVWCRAETLREGIVIKDIKVGNILAPENEADIIIGMNVDFKDVRGIGAPFIERVRRTRAITLGTVVTFDYDGMRQLHMLICHTIGTGGWEQADQYVRYGMDYLWKSGPERAYSIVQIGTGRIGKRDGADHTLIRSAMAASFLPVDLYVLNEPTRVSAEAAASILPFRPLRMWDIEHGQVPIPLVA